MEGERAGLPPRWSSPARAGWAVGLQLLVAVTALAALIVSVGMAIMWIRFDALDLPADRVVTVLPPKLLAVAGGQALLGPVLAATVVGLTTVAIGRRREDSARRVAWVLFMVVVVFGAVLAIARTFGDPRMEPVAVVLENDRGGIAGFYVGESGDRLYVVPLSDNGDPTGPFADIAPDRIASLPKDEVVRLVVSESVGIDSDDPGRDRAHTLLFDLLDAEASTAAVADPVATSDPARTFAPLVHLHADEKWLPIGVDQFLDRSALYWSNLPGCEPETVAAGRLHANRDLDGVTDPSRLGKPEMPYQRAPDAPDCGPPSKPVSFFATELTRPHVLVDRLPRLPPQQGFYLDLAEHARVGDGHTRSDGARTHLRRVPIYAERREERVNERPGLRITYWMLYGFSEPRDAEGRPMHSLTHEGDWEAVSVLLHQLGRHYYRPISVRYGIHKSYRDVPWRSVKRTQDGPRMFLTDEPTHPVVYSARGSHASYPRAGRHLWQVPLAARRGEVVVEDEAMACPACPQWETWRHVVDVDAQLWYGFGGAWGEVGPTSDTTGPLGPSRYR